MSIRHCPAGGNHIRKSVIPPGEKEIHWYCVKCHTTVNHEQGMKEAHQADLDNGFTEEELERARNGERIRR